jgi:hypothetical protein
VDRAAAVATVFSLLEPFPDHEQTFVRAIRLQVHSRDQLMPNRNGNTWNPYLRFSGGTKISTRYSYPNAHGHRTFWDRT